MEAQIFTEGTAASEFRDRIVARWPQWVMYLRRGDDRVEPQSSSSICAEIPSPAERGPALVVELTAGERARRRRGL